MRKIVLAAGLATSILALGACGNTPGDRALSGGAIGGGTTRKTGKGCGLSLITSEMPWL